MQKIMNYEDAVDYLKTTLSRGSRPGLSRIIELLELMDNPQRKTKVIHVTGTNGKGSVCRMLTSILQAQGYKTGLFASPYITRINESIQINSREIPDLLFAEIIGFIYPLAESMDDPPTEFEILTAAAFEYFYRSKCDIAVIECGMGGDADSTNVIEAPLLSVITNVAVDHSSFLGKTTAEIAVHKAGIIKKDRPLLFAGTDADADKVITEKAENMNSEIFHADYSQLAVKDFSLEGTLLDFGSYKNIRLSLLGLYQPQNCAAVLTAIDILRKYGLNISNEAVYSGLSNAVWNGRFEILCRKPLIIFDGSHNPHGMEYTVKSIKRYFNSKVIVLMGVMADKDYKNLAEQLSGVSQRVFTVTPNNPRALSSKLLAEVFSGYGVEASYYDSINSAAEAVYDYAVRTHLPILAVGSLYMYNDIRTSFENYRTKHI